MGPEHKRNIGSGFRFYFDLSVLVLEPVILSGFTGTKFIFSTIIFGIINFGMFIEHKICDSFAKTRFRIKIFENNTVPTSHSL